MRRAARPPTAPAELETEWDSRGALSARSSQYRGDSRPSSSSSGGGGGAPGSPFGWAPSAEPSADPFGGSSGGWRWGSSGTWSPKATPMIDNRSVSFQPHVRMQSSNFDGPTPTSSLGQGLIGLRRSSLVERMCAVAQLGDGANPTDTAVGLDPARERAVTRHGLHLQPPPEMDKVDNYLELLSYTNAGWSFGIVIAIGSQGLVQVSGKPWHSACPITQNAAFWRCCETPWQNVVVESLVPAGGVQVDSTRSPGNEQRRAAEPICHSSAIPIAQLARMAATDAETGAEPESETPTSDLTSPGTPRRQQPEQQQQQQQQQRRLTSVFRAICLSPAPDRQSIPVGMLFAFQEKPMASASGGPDFSKVVDSMSQTVRSGLERNANVMRREKELLAQSSLISMKRFVSGELPQSLLVTQDENSLGAGIFSQAAMSIRAIFKAHSCIIWDISCFRLFSSDVSSASQISDPNEAEAGPSAPNTWDDWNVRTTIQSSEDLDPLSTAPDAAGSEEGPEGSGGGALAVPEVVAKSVAEAASPSMAARLSLGEAPPTGDRADQANADGWTCSYPVTTQPVGIIGSSGGSMDHFEHLDGMFSRPMLAEFLATTKELGLSGRPQSEGEHIRTAESAFFGEASSLAGLLPQGCKGLVAVPVFETDDQPAFMIFAAFEDSPVLESADRHFVEQVGSILLTWSIRSRVARVDRAQTHFIQRIQHELRTPLHAVIGTLDVIKESLGERKARSAESALSQDQELAALVDSAATSADALNNMINNVLDFGALKAMPAQPKQNDELPCFRWNDISAAISDTCKSEWLSALQRGELAIPAVGATDAAGSAVLNTPELLLDLDSSDLTGDLIAAMDLEALQTVLRKLVSNAIRATSTGHVTIGLQISSRVPICERQIRPGSKPRPKDKTYDIQVTVEDTGKGMQRDFIESHLFAPYAKEDSFLPGSGLSLAIASRLVHRMGGHITVASSPDVGTKFSITLPVRFGRTKSRPSSSLSVASQHRVGVHFIGFDTPGLLKTKAILSRRHKLDDASPAEARILFVPAEMLDRAEEVLAQLSRLSPSSTRPSQLIVFERIDVKLEGPALDQQALDALLRKHDLSNDMQARKVPRPVGYKACAIIDMVKERVLFPHYAIRGGRSVRSTMSEASAAKTSSTRRSSESPSLSTPMSGDIKVYPFGLPVPTLSAVPPAETAVPKLSVTTEDSEAEAPAQAAAGVGPSDHRDVCTAAAEYAVEPATLQEVEVAAQSMQAPKDFVVMVVEDNPLNMRLMTTMLERAKIKFLQAWNGQEAVEMFAQHFPQIVLMDISMPVMDGFQACAEIRKIRPANLVREDGSPCHRIIAVTALSSEADRLRGREAGMDDWLKKPLKLSALLSDIKSWKAQLMAV